MARIRSIKPEFWTSEQIMECAPTTRLLFIGLWNFCDDHGRHPLATKQLRALIFPSDDFTNESVRGMIDELASNGLISIYVVDGKEYFQVTGWQHQKIDKPQSPKYPGPIAERSENDQRTVSTDRKGEGRGEGKGSAEPNGSGADAPTARIIQMPVDARKELFDEALPLLATYTGRTTDKLRSLVGKWLKLAGDDAMVVSRAIARAVAERRAEPIAWIERQFKPNDPDAAIYRNVL